MKVQHKASLPGRDQVPRLLDLGAADLAALAEQGFVSRDYRAYLGTRLGPYFKLRWRDRGRQRVRYLGRDIDWAQAVASFVAELQQPCLLDREASRLLRAARMGLRRAKEVLQPALAEQGVHLHGYRGRRRRTRHSRES